MKHSPFQSSYLQDFVVLEERQGNLTRYPRTDQLPLLARALKIEFESVLPHRIARVDERASDCRKIERRLAVEGFCYVINASRPDGLLLMPLLDKDRVAHPAVVQQITEETRRGPHHWFKFYVSGDFFTEILFCGRRMIFTGHAVDRFSTRAPALTQEPLRNLIIDSFETPSLAFPFANGLALFPAFAESVMALPYIEGEGELLISTCLSINEIHSFPNLNMPLIALNPHYGPMFQLPKTRTWAPGDCATELRHLWEHKVKVSLEPIEKAGRRWGDVAARIGDMMVRDGHGPGSRLIFLDHIPGPCCHILKPGEEELQYDEWEDYKEQAPTVDWTREFQELDKRLTVSHETRPKTWPEL